MNPQSTRADPSLFTPEQLDWFTGGHIGPFSTAKQAIEALYQHAMAMNRLYNYAMNEWETYVPPALLRFLSMNSAWILRFRRNPYLT
jgi:hypothetical protein